ncbi:DUF4855 domain-containing protein [Parabacteroides pacaensis]|uniref:DUF4855 domain-containing protein n=1 Tax=Parabacteroides pacaensis TaxID=2086575 RepID=UPI000D0F37D8|nr:DUF4855 domain-containing protein [Parabacteroides pacaensis]
MKIQSYILLVISSCFYFFTACSSNPTPETDSPQEPEAPEHIVVNIPSADRPTDMALIYHGYKSRPAWTAADLQPYIFRENNGKIEWLFDGFLFLEIYAEINGTEYDYGIANGNKIAPGKSEWENLLQKTFAEGKGPDGIEQTLDSLVQLGIQPPYKRQVMFCLPNPQIQCKNWGILNGRKLDFHKTADRLLAVKWYVERILKEWETKDYHYIQLAGFYWLHEQIDTHSLEDGTIIEDAQLIKEVQAYLKSLGYPLIWIPYYGAAGVDRWKELGFDIAYQQPNYFFSLESPINIITGAIGIAKKYNMSLEMEFDDRVTDPAYGKRFYTYLEEFEKAGAWNDFPIAYYEGGGAWLRMNKSYSPEMKKMVKALGDILVQRNGKFSVIKK